MKFLRDRFSASYKIETKRGVEVVMVNNEACVAILADVFKNQNAIHEFELDKFGREIVDTLNEYGYYPLSELIVWEGVLSHNLAAIDSLVHEFGSALLLEHYTPRFRYRVPKGNKSVGFFFSFMESLTNDLDIDEYSASQTTLEQIFNGFAREGEKEVVFREFPEKPQDQVLSFKNE
mmetsp:Transcript_42652/g.49913  ORF Transcript_42652/g.49913 Transcript_42652/m.49913 type:complete len:177 (+) Transcript_42652:1147-1677(+)